MGLSDGRATAVVSALNEIDGELAEKFKVRWEAHAAATRPLLVVFGEHNTGKTALIARLLIDAGHALPPGLTIGARAESTSGEPIEWDGWRILDLPGIGSDRRVHDVTAWDGVELADAILLVMQPKLLTGEGLEILRLVDGSWFTPGAEPLAWDGELVFAVAQADTGPADLELFPEAAQGYADQLESSLNAILGGVGGLRDAPLYVTAPSPNALLDHVENPTPASFDSYREWDGMADLANALMGLAATKERLRPTAMRRFLLRHVRVALERASEDRAQLADARDKAELAAKTHETINSEIDSVTATTEIKLRAVLTECFVAVYERAPSAMQAPTLLHQEFAKRAEAFERRFVVDAERLIEETGRLVADLPTILLSRPGPSATPTTTKPSRERVTVGDATSSAKGRGSIRRGSSSRRFREIGEGQAGKP